MKKYTEIIDYDKLQEILVVSNTPMYLFSSYQQNQSILDLFASYSDQNLIEFFYSELKNEKNLKNTTTLYALIVALFFKDSSYATGFFINLKKKPEIKWADIFADYYFSKTSFSTLERSIQPNLSYAGNSDASNTDTINFKFE